MENTKLLKRRLFAVLKAALLGAAVADGLIVWVNVAPGILKHVGLAKLWDELFGLLPYLMAVPSIWAAKATGGRLSNAYIVNALLGALIFAAATALCQFAPKPHEN